MSWEGKLMLVWEFETIDIFCKRCENSGVESVCLLRELWPGATEASFHVCCLSLKSLEEPEQMDVKLEFHEDSLLPYLEFWVCL